MIDLYECTIEGESKERNIHNRKFTLYVGEWVVEKLRDLNINFYWMIGHNDLVYFSKYGAWEKGTLETVLSDKRDVLAVDSHHGQYIEYLKTLFDLEVVYLD